VLQRRRRVNVQGFRKNRELGQNLNSKLPHLQALKIWALKFNLNWAIILELIFKKEFLCKHKIIL